MKPANPLRMVLIAAVAGLLAARLAADAPAPAARTVTYESTLSKLTRTLGLSEDQQARISAIWEECIARSNQIMADKFILDEERADRLFAVSMVQHEKIRAVLTDAQKQVYDALYPKPYERVTKTRI